MSALCCQCFSLLDWEDPVRVKLKLHISRYFILFLGLWQCSLYYCSSIVEQDPQIMNSWDILDYLKVVSIFSGGGSFRPLQWKFLLCLYICGCLKHTLKEVLQVLYCWQVYSWSLGLIDSYVSIYTYFLTEVHTFTLLLVLFVWLELFMQVRLLFDK
jgi:hypothetical protein